MQRTTLKRIAKLRNIKNFNGLTKENLIYTLLRSQKSLYENNYFNYIRNDTDDRIRAKVDNIRIELARLENIITKEDRDKFRKYAIENQLYEIENKTGLTDTQKNEIYNCHCEIGRDLEIKRKYRYSDLEIKDIELLYSNSNYYYRPILAKHAFDENYEF